MPIYEYWCDSCCRTVSSYRPVLLAAPPSCPHCNSGRLKRVFSTFSVHRTHSDIYEDILSDNQLTEGMMRDDPRALAEWSRRMDCGEKSPPEYEEITQRMDRGEWPADQMQQVREKSIGSESGSLEEG